MPHQRNSNRLPNVFITGESITKMKNSMNIRKNSIPFLVIPIGTKSSCLMNKTGKEKSRYTALLKLKKIGSGTLLVRTLTCRQGGGRLCRVISGWLSLLPLHQVTRLEPKSNTAGARQGLSKFVPYCEVSRGQAGCKTYLLLCLHEFRLY
jgi:hypothetical protein